MGKTKIAFEIHKIILNIFEIEFKIFSFFYLFFV